MNHVGGQGVQFESDPFLSARDKVVGYTPRVRVDILIEDDNVDPILDTLRMTTTSLEGNGVDWVTAVE